MTGSERREKKRRGEVSSSRERERRSDYTTSHERKYSPAERNSHCQVGSALLLCKSYQAGLAKTPSMAPFWQKFCFPRPSHPIPSPSISPMVRGITPRRHPFFPAPPCGEGPRRDFPLPQQVVAAEDERRWLGSTGEIVPERLAASLPVVAKMKGWLSVAATTTASTLSARCQPPRIMEQSLLLRPASTDCTAFANRVAVDSAGDGSRHDMG